MMMRMNTNTVSAARVSNKSSAATVVAPRRAVSVAASKGSKENANFSTIQEGARTGLAAVSAFCLGVSLLISPVQPAQAVIPADNGAGLIKSGENALPQPLNKLKDSSAEYKDPAVAAGTNAVQNVSNGSDGVKSVNAFLQGKASAAKDAISDKVDDLSSSAKDAAKNVKYSAQDAAADVKSNVKSVNYTPTDTNDVQSRMTDLAKDAEKAGGQKNTSANALLQQGKEPEATNVKTDDSTKGVNTYQQKFDNIKAAADKINSGERSPLA